jgi:hypothetical protein
MKKLFCLFYLVPFFGTSQIQHLDSVQSKTIGTAWSGLNKFASLQEKHIEGQAFYYLVYENYFDAHDTKLIKFTGGQSVLDELYKSLLDAITKRQGGKTFFKLGDQVLYMEVKKGSPKKFLDISADCGGFELSERQINKLFGK